MFESRREPWEEGRVKLAAAGSALIVLSAGASLVLLQVAKRQCLGDPADLVTALRDRNEVCRALGLPDAAGAGNHALLIGLLLLPVLLAASGTASAVANRSFRALVVGVVLSGVSVLALVVLAGNAGLGHLEGM